MPCSSPVPPMSLISAITITAGGPSSMRRTAGSSPASNPTGSLTLLRELAPALRVPRSSPRPHRLLCPLVARSRRNSLGGHRCPRGAGQDRDRQGAAHPVQRSRRPRRRDRRSLQAALGHRAVLPLGQADPQDHPLPRHLGQCRAHPDRRRPYRLPAAPPRSGHPEKPSSSRPSGLRPPRPRQPHAPPPPRPPARDRTHPQFNPDQMALQWS